ncbi:carbohydrate ABC transporter permease [Cohnella sp. LGH]|uniref:carbohydrate ABC transporter permease n=1 Tax=Cohnella sp. LGH TaxID=1619153 RepID=UPI001ADB6ADB|nr:carbohydrate ABC transporter permease [Cohnella sp. LGH]QTH43143.1 carbohydrate ABC transporter permease [Cohnella sp. LGH]
MIREGRYTLRLLSLEAACYLLGLLFLVPFYFVLSNSVKSFSDLLSNAASWPQSFVWSNYSRTWEIMNYPRAFANSFIITAASIAGIVVISAMAAYHMVRRPTRVNNFLFGLFVAAMIIPFQSVMIPLVKVLGSVDLMNSRTGLIVCFFGFGAPLSLFLYHGFIKSIPLEVEESAIMDGCSLYGVFWRIVFPLMKSATVTIVLLNSLWIWNDFLLPLLVLYDPDKRTIPLAIYAFFGQYSKQWDLALAGLVMGIVPILGLFLALQRQIIAGITAGAVKG